MIYELNLKLNKFEAAAYAIIGTHRISGAAMRAIECQFRKTLIETVNNVTKVTKFSQTVRNVSINGVTVK